MSSFSTAEPCVTRRFGFLGCITGPFVVSGPGSHDFGGRGHFPTYTQVLCVHDQRPSHVPEKRFLFDSTPHQDTKKTLRHSAWISPAQGSGDIASSLWFELWEGALLVRKMSTHQKALGQSDDLGLSSICFFPQIELEVQRGGGPQKEIPMVCWVSMLICGVILRLGVGKLNRAAADSACNSIGWLFGCACWAKL